jgi:hypothetical protein
MLLLTFNEFLGHRQFEGSSTISDATQYQIAFYAKHANLTGALQLVKTYQDEYEKKYPKRALNFRLLTVANVPDASDESLESVGVENLETLMNGFLPSP